MLINKNACVRDGQGVFVIFFLLGSDDDNYVQSGRKKREGKIAVFMCLCVYM